MSNRISTPQDFIMSSIVCFKSLFDNWAKIIDEYDSPDETSLRRNAVCIWFNALIEYWQRKGERAQCLEALSQSHSDLSAIEAALMAFDNLVESMLNEFTTDEQVALWYVRNSVLHGHLSLHFKDDMKVTVFDSTAGQVIKVQRTRKEFENAIHSICGNPTERIRALSEFKFLLENYNLYLQHQAVDQYSEVLFGSKVPNA